MGQRGPKRKPTAELKLHGSWRADQRAKEEIQPPPGSPEPPDWLTTEARQVWDKLVPLLEATPGLLTKVDGIALGRYCDSLVRWIALLESVRRNGETYELHNESGDLTSVQARPEVWIVKSLAEQMSKLEREFGLTPSARAGLSANAKPGEETQTRKICGL